MGLFLIILIIAVGILLLLGEFLLLPGTTLLGILGTIVVLVGVYFGYTELGTSTGHIIFATTIVVLGILFAIGLRTMSSRDMGLEHQLTGRVNEIDDLELMIGDEGEAFGDIRPIGKAVINGVTFEVISQEGYVDNKEKVEVVKITGSEIYIKPKHT